MLDQLKSGIDNLKKGLELPRQIISFILIFASIILVIFVASETGRELAARDPIRRYDKLMVEVYLESDDWQHITMIEDSIYTPALDEVTLERYQTQVWKNYLKRPETYWDRHEMWGGRKYPLVDGYWNIGSEGTAPFDEDEDVSASWRGIFKGKGGEFYAIIDNRLNYKLTAEEIEKLRNPTLAWITSIITDANNIRFALQQNTTPFNAYQSIRKLTENLNGFSQELTSENKSFDSFSKSPLADFPIVPRYQWIIYDGFRRVEDMSLIDIGFQVLADETEDPLLRLEAAKYISKYPKERSKLTDQLFSFLALNKNLNQLTDSPKSTEEIVLQRGFLSILGKILYAQYTDEIQRRKPE